MYVPWFVECLGPVILTSNLYYKTIVFCERFCYLTLTSKDPPNNMPRSCCGYFLAEVVAYPLSFNAHAVGLGKG